MRDHQRIVGGGAAMNRKSRTVVAAISLMGLFAAMLFAQATPKLTGPYLGQKPPGKTPVPFAIGHLGADLHGGPVFSQDGKEVFWSLMGGKQHILTSRLTEDGWSSPQAIKFPTGSAGTGESAYHQREYVKPSGEPCLSYDGTRLFFMAQETAATDYRESIWVSERTKDGWGTPKQVSPLVNEMSTHWQMSVAKSGNLYFQGRSAMVGDIYVSTFADGEYQKPVALGSAINTRHDEGCPFVAPDESYLVFYRINRGSSQKADLFISFKTPDGTWAKAKSMDKLNRGGVNEVCPSVSRDGKYFFFLRSTRDGLSSYWVSARVLDDYR